MSPRTKWLIQVQYWVRTGRSVPSWCVERMDCVRRGERAEDCPSGIAGQHLRDEEHDHAQDPQRDQRQADSLEDEDRHAAIGRARW